MPCCSYPACLENQLKMPFELLCYLTSSPGANYELNEHKDEEEWGGNTILRP